MAKRKFDLVTVLGVVLALAMLIGAQMYSAQRQEALRQWQAQAALEQKNKEASQPSEVVKADPSSGAGEKKTADVKPTEPKEPKQEPKPEPKPEEPKVAEDVEPKDAGDIAISTNKLDLVFSAQGATLKKATLNQELTDAADKNGPKGVEILDEIELGKRTFAMPSFEIGPPEAERQKERLLFDQPTGGLKSPSRRVWKLDQNTGTYDAEGNWKLVYSAVLGGKYTIAKTITINKDSDLVDCEISVSNGGAEPVTYSYALMGPAGILLDGPPHDPRRGAYVYVIAEVAGREALASGRESTAVDIKQVDPGTAAKEQDSSSAISYNENLWGALKNRFFLAMLISRDPAQLIKLKAVPIKHDLTRVDKRYAEPNAGIVGIRRNSETLAPNGKTAGDRYALYLGPSDEKRLNEVDAAISPNRPLHLSNAIHYCDIFGWQWPRVDWVARKMMWLFQGLYSAFGSYGLAVILLTLVIKLALHPMQRKMTISMTKMAKLQPEIKKIQVKYKGSNAPDAQRKMVMEQQDLMKKHGVSYGAGCLPIFLQIPIFSALYGIFNRAFDIRGAQFLWINDLSQQDHLATLSFWPHVLNLLPLIYMGVTILQTRLTPAPKSDDPQQEMNRKMMTFMPIVFSLLFYSMPSGLVLYFAASAVFGMLETWYIRKFLIKDEPLAAASDKSGKPPPAVVRVGKTATN
jgi:YidC/Oxa1 family membrane protein insertase